MDFNLTNVSGVKRVDGRREKSSSGSSELSSTCFSQTWMGINGLVGRSSLDFSGWLIFRGNQQITLISAQTLGKNLDKRSTTHIAI